MKQSGLNIQVSASVSFMKVHGGASSMTDEQKQVNSFSHSLTFSLSLYLSQEVDLLIVII